MTIVPARIWPRAQDDQRETADVAPSLAAVSAPTGQREEGDLQDAADDAGEDAGQERGCRTGATSRARTSWYDRRDRGDDALPLEHQRGCGQAASPTGRRPAAPRAEREHGATDGLRRERAERDGSGERAGDDQEREPLPSSAQQPGTEPRQVWPSEAGRPSTACPVTAVSAPEDTSKCPTTRPTRRGADDARDVRGRLVGVERQCRRCRDSVRTSRRRRTGRASRRGTGASSLIAPSNISPIASGRSGTTPGFGAPYP